MNRSTIRSAVVEDAPAVADLAGQLGYPTETDVAGARLAPIVAESDQAFLVAELPTGRVAGWIHVYVTRLVESVPFAELGGFVVDEGCRGQGVGRRLLDAAEAWVREKGVARMRIRTRSDRHEAHVFYEKMGYGFTKQQHIYDKEL